MYPWSLFKYCCDSYEDHPARRCNRLPTLCIAMEWAITVSKFHVHYFQFLQCITSSILNCFNRLHLTFPLQGGLTISLFHLFASTTLAPIFVGRLRRLFWQPRIFSSFPCRSPQTPRCWLVIARPSPLFIGFCRYIWFVYCHHTNRMYLLYLQYTRQENG